MRFFVMFVTAFLCAISYWTVFVVEEVLISVAKLNDRCSWYFTAAISHRQNTLIYKNLIH